MPKQPAGPTQRQGVPHGDVAWRTTAMKTKIPRTRSGIGAGIAVSVVALTLSACGSSDYDRVVAENQQLKAQLAQSQAEQTFVVAGDLLFPPGGYQLSA